MGSNNQTAREIVMINGLIEENKRLEEKVLKLNEELGKKDAQLFDLQSQLRAKKEYQSSTYQTNEDVVLISHNMFFPQYGGING